MSKSKLTSEKNEDIDHIINLQEVPRLSKSEQLLEDIKGQFQTAHGLINQMNQDLYIHNSQTKFIKLKD